MYSGKIETVMTRSEWKKEEYRRNNRIIKEYVRYLLFAICIVIGGILWLFSGNKLTDAIIFIGTFLVCVLVNVLLSDTEEEKHE